MTVHRVAESDVTEHACTARRLVTAVTPWDIFNVVLCHMCFVVIIIV